MRALKPGSNRRFQAVPNPNEIAARTTMGNCIGINRNDPETLDTGSANVTRPVTGKCHDGDDLQASREYQGRTEVFSFPAGLALALGLCYWHHKHCKPNERKKKPDFYQFVWSFVWRLLSARGWGGKSAQNFKCGGSVVCESNQPRRPLTRNREARGVIVLLWVMFGVMTGSC